MFQGIKIRVSPLLLTALSGKTLPKNQPKQALPQPPSKQPRPRTAPSKMKKKAISIRLDVDVLDWFKAQPGKYQQRMNEACRLYMETCQAAEVATDALVI